MDEKYNDYEEKSEKEFHKFSKKGYSENDAKKVLDNENKIIDLFLKNEKLRDFIDEVKLFFRLVRDFVMGEYRNVPLGTIVSIVGSLLYVLSPLDVISDLIPVIGFLDDAAVMGLCMKFVHDDVQDYKNWLEDKE